MALEPDAVRRRLGTPRIILPILGLVGMVHHGTSGAQAPPGTDIWVFGFREEASRLDLSSGIRATDRPGYDNQPYFLPGGQFLLFTSVDSSGQADIHRLDLQRGTAEPLTHSSPESEYSATLTPAGDRISVIRVEADSTQRLWSFDLEGKNPSLILEAIEPVGYHAWIDRGRLALFVLGSPATLQVASVETGQARIVARDIGRSLHRIPGRATISFVQWEDGRRGVITELDPDSGEDSILAPTLEGNEFHAWTPGGALLTGQGSKLFMWVPGVSQAWEEIADLATNGVTGISRIAVSPEGDRIAIVGVGG
jgi:dipeptidyl aminopeptidase/acylaminoacyl peptidase